MAFLIGYPEGSVPPVQEIAGDRLLIGRGTNAGLRLDDPSVNWEHATIEKDARGFRLVDAGSATGTYLNGEKIDAANLHDGDTVGIGPYLIEIREAPNLLGLALRRVAETEPEQAAAAPFAEVDYLRAYRLTRPFLTKASLALLATLIAAAVLLSIPAVGALRAFQPGPVSASHERARVGCLECHAPWKGPTKSLCADCHKRSEHQLRQAFEPDCADCHFEHRGERSLTLVDDRNCVRCHGSLEVAGGGLPAVETAIAGFPDQHPDFSLPPSDPTSLRFGHAKHLKPLITGEGRAQLVCADCHQVGKGAGPTAMRPVAYDFACARCHPLTFDSGLADEQAPHGDPLRVREFLLRVYSDRREVLSIRELRQRLLRNPGSLPPIDLSRRATEAVLDAERYLYGIACQKCHVVDMEATPVPAVTRPEIPLRWLTQSRPFPHDRHQTGLACADCHQQAAESVVTSDVLVPGLDACAGCHGGSGKPPGEAKRRLGPHDCRSCHVYHGGLAAS